MGVYAVIPASGRQEQEGWEFQASLSYLVTFCLRHKQQARESPERGLCYSFMGR